MSFISIKNNPDLKGLVTAHKSFIYSERQQLEAILISPANFSNTNKAAILFVQGSGFKGPLLHPTKIHHLSMFAKAGYVVMSITHRDCREGHPFPAYLEDAKCAVRYLRAHAEEYGIDPDKIGMFGTSSGANATMLTAMTANDPRYKTEEYAEFSDHIACAVQAFGPTIMEKMPERIKEELGKPLIGQKDGMEVMREMSPYCILNEKTQMPPLLMIQGDADPTVPYEQAELMYEKMTALGKEVDFIRVEGAVHERDCWSEEVYARIHAFFDKHLL